MTAKTTASRAAERLLETFLAGKAQRTQEAYLQDLQRFARFLEIPGPADVAEWLITSDRAELLHRLAMFREDLRQHYAPATGNRQLCALRGLVATATDLEQIAVSVPRKYTQPFPAVRYRDTSGPGRPVVEAMLRAASRHPDLVKRSRDVLLLRLLYDVAMRRAEVVELDMERMNLSTRPPTISILGKGRRERELIALPPATAKAMRRWIQVRGRHRGPLFFGLRTKYARRRRLDGSGLYRIVHAWGKAVGCDHVRPHGLRHTAITEALRTHPAAEVRKFSRHASLDTLQRYIDSPADTAAIVAVTVAEGLNLRRARRDRAKPPRKPLKA